MQGLARADVCILKGQFLTPPDPNAISGEDRLCALTTPRRRQPMLSPDLDLVSAVGLTVHFMVLDVNDETRAFWASHRWLGRL